MLCHACLEDGTLHNNRHDAHRSYQDAGAISARPGHRPGQLHARRLTLQYLIVYLLQQISTVHPRFGEKTTTSDPSYMYTAPPCVYKRRRRAPSWANRSNFSSAQTLIRPTPLASLAHSL